MHCSMVASECEELARRASSTDVIADRTLVVGWIGYHDPDCQLPIWPRHSRVANSQSGIVMTPTIFTGSTMGP